ncbi:hypothetical protein EV215_0125 [Hypnocyclicus thermotrophus]|uniref:Nucleoside recognition protein n=1 Tax=Hypnocyclicus thermotrophus TaxID=1627895 RepID=A0AA46I6C8_9FUSO|nr:hypothetical protein [Hypnocyclicus thermotrophus]TDT72325.1 hypothetical protein EV215_0125 [Hypnocyclicus thermotrophus]
MNIIFKNLKKSINLTITLFKILLPLSIFIKILQLTNSIDYILGLFLPIAKITGISTELATVWITAMLTNIYGGFITLSSFAKNNVFTVADITVLATMILLAHTMFLETAILKKAGGKSLYIVLLRVGSAILVGSVFNFIFKTFNILNYPANIIWKSKSVNFTINEFIFSQIKSFFYIFFIIFLILTMMDIFEKIGVLKLINKLLNPLLALLGISDKGININLIALVLGISYGGAILIEESSSGELSTRDITYSIIFISLCHAIIEDSLLMLTIGANFIWITIGRFFYTIVFLIIFNKIYLKIINFSSIIKKV